MKTFLLILLIAVAVLAAVLAFVASRQPDDFFLTRSTVIAAPPEAISAQVNDLHRWPTWSPWADLDPNMQYVYAGPPTGVGSSAAWVGNRKAGQGKMTILESKPGERIRILLEFQKPFAVTNTAEFTFVPQGGGTLVTWSLSGKNNFMFKALHSVMNMDKMVGPDFERGLRNLKTITEAGAPIPAGGGTPK